MPGKRGGDSDPELLVVGRLLDLRKKQPDGELIISGHKLFEGIPPHQKTRLMTEISGVLVTRARGRGNGGNYVMDGELTEIPLWRWRIRPPLSSQAITDGILRRRGK